MDSKYTAVVVSFALTAVISAATAISVYTWRKKWLEDHSTAEELRKSLASALEKCASERQGRIRAQQALRKAVTQPRSDSSGRTSYPLAPIGVIRSCFSTRNGTPRQPLLVPLARACLVFDSSTVPPASLEGIEEYSHCWIIYVFHLNTDLEKLWKDPTKSKFKAKVRVPRLKGERKGVFATRSPHRPCPIGLTVAKVEAVKGHMLLLSGADLVDGTPVLDVKPYLPYCDSVMEAIVPKWVQMENMLVIPSVSFSNDFSTSLMGCWKSMGKRTLYASAEELKTLVKQVLSWDIRSVSQRNRPHDVARKKAMLSGAENSFCSDYSNDDEASASAVEQDLPSEDTIYHLILEAIDFSYRIDADGNVMVENAHLSSGIFIGDRRCNFSAWEDVLR